MYEMSLLDGDCDAEGDNIDYDYGYDDAHDDDDGDCDEEVRNENERSTSGIRNSTAAHHTRSHASMSAMVARTFCVALRAPIDDRERTTPNCFDHRCSHCMPHVHAVTNVNAMTRLSISHVWPDHRYILRSGRPPCSR